MSLLTEFLFYSAAVNGTFILAFECCDANTRDALPSRDPAEGKVCLCSFKVLKSMETIKTLV